MHAIRHASRHPFTILRKQVFTMTTNTIIGTVGADPRFNRTADNVPVVSFRVAVTERRFDARSAQWIDGQTSWITIVAFRALAENIAQSVKKGQRIVAVGQLRVSPWESEGKTGLNVELIANEVGTSLLFGTTEYTQTAGGGRAEGDAAVNASLTLAGANA
jgi:single-strand DNA-binding protein